MERIEGLRDYIHHITSVSAGHHTAPSFFKYQGSKYLLGTLASRVGFHLVQTIVMLPVVVTLQCTPLNRFPQCVFKILCNTPHAMIKVATSFGSCCMVDRNTCHVFIYWWGSRNTLSLPCRPPKWPRTLRLVPAPVPWLGWGSVTSSGPLQSTQQSMHYLIEKFLFHMGVVPETLDIIHGQVE